MIIRRVAVGQSPQQSAIFAQQEKNATPRVVIKLKKTAKVQLCQQISEESVLEGEGNFFNDSNYFNYQHKHGNSQEHYKEIFAKPPHLQNIRNKSRQNYGENGTRQDLSRNLFSEFLKKQPIQIPQGSHPSPSGNTCQSQRKYSCPSNRKDFFENVGAVFSRGSGSLKQPQNSQQLVQLNSKTIKGNHSCYVVNPYTKKEYFHQRVTQSSGQQRRKNLKSLHYSIIKPNEIRCVPFSNRDEKSMAKRKERKQFPQLLAAIKRKQELLAQRRVHREEVRMMVHTSYVNRRREVVFEEDRNELQPWEVDAINNFADMI